MNVIQKAQREIAKEVVVDSIDRANGRLMDAAKILGISRQAIRYWVNVFGIDYKKYRIPEPDRSGNSAPYNPPDEEPERQILCD